MPTANQTKHQQSFDIYDVDQQDSQMSCWSDDMALSYLPRYRAQVRPHHAIQYHTRVRGLVSAQKICPVDVSLTNGPRKCFRLREFLCNGAAQRCENGLGVALVIVSSVALWRLSKFDVV